MRFRALLCLIPSFLLLGLITLFVGAALAAARLAHDAEDLQAAMNRWIKNQPNPTV